MLPFMTWTVPSFSFQTLFRYSYVSSFSLDLLAVSVLPYDPDPRSLSVVLYAATVLLQLLQMTRRQVHICTMLEEWIVGLFPVKDLVSVICVSCMYPQAGRWCVACMQRWQTPCDTAGSCAQAQPLLVLVSHGSQLPAAVFDELSPEAVYTVKCKGSPRTPLYDTFSHRGTFALTGLNNQHSYEKFK